MKLLPTQTNEESLSALGEEARALLLRRDFAGLASRFGYALAYDRAPTAAIEADFLGVAASPLTASSTAQPVTVKYFAPNNTGLIAVVECLVPVADGAVVLLELIVAGNESEKHITVEDMSGVAA